MDAIESQLTAFLQAAYTFVQPQSTRGMSLVPFALTNLENILRGYVWFIVAGLVIYAVYGRQPGERFSLIGGFKFILPSSIYRHASFKFDLLWLPFQIALSFFVFSALSIGAEAVQHWLAGRFGPSPISIPEGGIAVALQVIFILLAADFARFLWHYQGHSMPLFWAFHHGHHSAEVLHPFFVRTHPMDMLVRMAYMGALSGILGGSLIYITGMTVTGSAAAWVTGIGSAALLFQHFEHSHIRISFGKFLDRIFYAPHMHQIHHSAIVAHHDKNLGITGGLILWDYLFGTLYWRKPGEEVIYGGRLDELGENNPHRTLKGFLLNPFKVARKALKEGKWFYDRNPNPTAPLTMPDAQTSSGVHAARAAAR